MKNLIKVAVISVSLLIFSGCTPATFQSVKAPGTGHEIKIAIPKDKKDKRVWIRNTISFNGLSWDKRRKIFAETFYTAAKYGKDRGYSYFAITKKTMNNLNGFPINNFNNAMDFCEWEDTNKAYRPRPLCLTGEGLISISANLEVQYFKEPIPGLFLYNIDEVIAETKKYL